jgi:hypothetical protein
MSIEPLIPGKSPMPSTRIAPQPGPHCQTMLAVSPFRIDAGTMSTPSTRKDGGGMGLAPPMGDAEGVGLGEGTDVGVAPQAKSSATQARPAKRRIMPHQLPR